MFVHVSSHFSHLPSICGQSPTSSSWPPCSLKSQLALQQWCSTMCNAWSRDCSWWLRQLSQPEKKNQSVISPGAVFGRKSCRLLAGTVCPPLHMVPKYSVIMVKHSYTAIKTTSDASIWRQETMTPQPSCQLMCVNNYNKKSVADPFDFKWSGTPVESKPDLFRAPQDYASAFSQQMTPLGQSRLSFHHSSIPLTSVSFRPGC